jgi:hypothetical protein
MCELHDVLGRERHGWKVISRLKLNPVQKRFRTGPSDRWKSHECRFEIGALAVGNPCPCCRPFQLAGQQVNATLKLARVHIDSRLWLGPDPTWASHSSARSAKAQREVVPLNSSVSASSVAVGHGHRRRPSVLVSAKLVPVMGRSVPDAK